MFQWNVKMVHNTENILNSNEGVSGEDLNYEVSPLNNTYAKWIEGNKVPRLI